MEFRVLGPLEVADGDRPVDLGGPRQRALLARLLVHANEVVAAERLIEDLWGEGSTGANALQVSVSRLRRALGTEARLVTQPPGYLLRVGPGELDRDEFERLSSEARHAARSRDERRVGGGHAAPCAGPLARATVRRLPLRALRASRDRPAGRAHMACLEERIEADLALGRHSELVGELEALTHEHPLRERPRSQLMLALYRSGRQADALGRLPGRTPVPRGGARHRAKR